MSVDPTAMNMGATVTAAAPSTALATRDGLTHLQGSARAGLRQQRTVPLTAAVKTVFEQV